MCGEIVKEEINFDDNVGENDILDENDNRDNYLTRAYCVVTTFMPAESFVCPGLVAMYTGNANDDDEEDDVFSNDNTTMTTMSTMIMM